MASTSTTCSILLNTWAREMRSAFSWYCTLVWWRSYKHTHKPLFRLVAIATVPPDLLRTFSTASGKFLLKKRTTSFTLELLLVLTVII